MFLQLMELQQVKTVAKKGVISASILAAHHIAEDCCASYFTVAAPMPADLGLYDQLVHVMNVIRSRVTFLERRVIYVIDLLQIFYEFSRATDPMPSYLVELELGELSPLEAKQFMRKAYTIQKQLEKVWCYYHADHGVVKSIDIIRNPMMISH